MSRRNRYRERRYRRRRDNYNNYGRGITSLFRRPSTQITVLVVVALVIYLLLQAGRNHNNAAASVPVEGGIPVGEAFNKYQSGAFHA